MAINMNYQPKPSQEQQQQHLSNDKRLKHSLLFKITFFGFYHFDYLIFFYLFEYIFWSIVWYLFGVFVSSFFFKLSIIFS